MPGVVWLAPVGDQAEYTAVHGGVDTGPQSAEDTVAEGKGEAGPADERSN